MQQLAQQSQSCAKHGISWSAIVFKGETSCPHRNSPPTDTGVRWWKIPEHLWRGVIHQKYTATPNSKRQVPSSCGRFTAIFWTIHPKVLTLSSRNVPLCHGRHTLVIAHTVTEGACLFANGWEFNSLISMATPVPVVAGLLRLWVRIPPEAWMFVVCVVSATSWLLVQRSPPECVASLCVIRNLKNKNTVARVGPQLHRGKKSMAA